MIGEGCNIAEPIITIITPLTTSLEIRIRSGKLTNAHMLRYSPNTRNTTA